MKLIKVILSILFAFVLLWVVVAFFSPKYISVKESIIINHSPNTIFSQVNDFKNWNNWSEWNRKDSLMKLSYSNPSFGENSTITWLSESEGNGSQKIIESIAFEKIRFLVQIDDWDDNYSNWTFNELEEFKTEVTWEFEDAEIAFLIRPMGFSFSNSIKSDYIKSLENLKYFCENEKQENKKIMPTLVQTEAFNYLAKHISCTNDEFNTELGKALGELMTICSKNKWEIDGMPFVINFDDMNDIIEFEAAFKILQEVKAPRGYTSGVIPAGETVVVSHYGLYENLPASYILIENWIRDNNYSPDGNSYEIYLTDPGSEPDSSKWETQIFYPVKKVNNEAILN